MNNGKIIWFIEHMSRELDVAAVVKALLQNKFHKKITILPYEFNKRFSKYSPDIVLLPHCYSINDPELSNFLTLWPTAVYINLAWEQIFYKANLEYKAPRDEFAKKYIIHHSWSKKRKVFLESKGVPKKNIFTNGQPAYQLYKNPYRKIFADRKFLAREFKLDSHKKWLFFPENYSWFFYSEHNLEDIIKHGQSREVVYTMKNYCRKSLSFVLEWLGKASEKYQDNYEIILRPRPAFSLEYFQNKMKEHFPEISPKIRIIKDYSVREWIMASDLIVSSFSTSLIEAAIAHKPIYMLEPFKIPQVLMSGWYDHVLKIKRLNEFLRLFELKNYQHSYNKLFYWAKKEFFVKPDPIMGLVDFLGKFNVREYHLEKNNINYLISTLKTSKSGWKSIKNHIINLLGKIKRSVADDASYYRNDDQERYLSEIKVRVKKCHELFRQ